MRRHAALALGAVLAAAACGTEPALLEITLDLVPAYARTDETEFSGLVTRAPPKNTSIVVSASGGREAATDTADAAGKFQVRVRLNRNTSNSITFVAADGTGAMSAPEARTIVHDDRPPTIVSMTPTNQSEDAPTSGDVVVVFNEAIALALDATVELATAGDVIGGVASVSADSLTLTFVPPRARRTNSVYEIRFDGVADAAGNPVGGSGVACFVTQRSGSEQVTADPANDVFATLGATRRSPSDLVELRLGVYEAVLTGVLKFTSARSFDTAAVNNLFAAIELDIDQDSTTGVRSIKDTVFSQLGFESGTRVEYLIGLEPNPSLGDSAYVGRYREPFLFDATELFLPAFCGPFVGFAASFGSLGDDDGNFNYVVTTFNIEGVEFVVDPMPTEGHLTATFAGQFTPPAWAAGASDSGRTGRVGLRLRDRLRRR